MSHSPNKSIVLATMNARYSHSSFGLRYLWANMGELQERSCIREFTLRESPAAVAKALLAMEPQVIGLGVYIWNVTPLTEVVRLLKAARPDLVIVLGGPEVSYEYEDVPIFQQADYLIRGEGDLAFAALMRQLAAGARPAEKVIPQDPTDWIDLTDLSILTLPYAAYTDEDIANRAIFVEASRGCPFQCEFCLSSLSCKVREFPLDTFLDAMQQLLDRGVRWFRFVDRTFNLKPSRSTAILEFFLERWQDGMQLHLEIVPDTLSQTMLELIQRFPETGLHLEIGIQSFHPPAQEAISRRQDLTRTETVMRFLREETGAVVHADLIAGLPEEDLATFGKGFDRLLALRPQEIQVGILKRLKGAPIQRHEVPHALHFSPDPPYEILESRAICREDLARIKRFARFMDLYYNHGHFPTALDLLWESQASAFTAFMAFSEHIWATTQQTHRFSLSQLAQMLYDFLLQQAAHDPARLRKYIEADFYAPAGREGQLNLSENE